MHSRFASAARGVLRRAAAPARTVTPAVRTVAASIRPPAGAARAVAARTMATQQLPGYPTTTLEDYFGSDIFNAHAQKSYLPKAVYKEVQDCITSRKPVSPELADAFAQGLVRWAEERGVTHFAHWFQPMTEGFAYKHDSLIKKEGDHIITQLTGKMLAIGEPDGSSFPNGGLRDTHSARGYTVWDPATPCFVANHGTGTTLCIPSVFFSWKGHALDEKTPLLRSIAALEREAVPFLKVVVDGTKRVHADSGVEQEFFLIDKEYYLSRPDLMQTGRTLQGAAPPKGQLLDDQYFGPFSDRFLQMLNDAEHAMWKLGIPQTTRHREVAPGQYEMAPIYCPVSYAGDHNLLQMDVLTRTADAHGLAVLYHEKPFAGVNGSGKHNNWSMGTNKSGTIMDPGAKPETNLAFMTALAAIIRGVHLHGDVLRCAVASAGNDHRLGANEAPPAIMSVFLGSDVTAAVNKFIGASEEDAEAAGGDLGCSGLPVFKLDATDRNRTSPFAFTGNKFEFRAVGSSHNPTRSSTYLNTIVADSFRHMTKALEARVGGEKLGKSEMREAAKAVVVETLKEHMVAVFDGDNYSDEWKAEAARRGLLNTPSTPEAIAAFNNDKNVELFSSMEVLVEEEFRSRVDVVTEQYVVKIHIEAAGLLNIARNIASPAAVEHQTKVAGAVLAAKSAGAPAAPHTDALLADATGTLDELSGAVVALEAALADAHADSLQGEADYCLNTIVPAMAAVRAACDSVESKVDADSWPLPTYHEMLFHQA